MLYGNLIFIKKTGGDGSKYPVTEKNIKIGRSENCLIRIYNPQVAPEHCQLIIDCNGQAKLRNLFTPTILNGKALGQGDVTLCHGDVFKLGERLARWEYLPTSKYFRQLLSPTKRLVAVVNPQRRSVETPEVSATQASVCKTTPPGSKRKLSEKFVTESSSVAKQRRTVGLDASLKPTIDLGKLLIGRHSMKSGKLVLKTPLIKQRKSISGIFSSGTPKSKPSEKSRKSTLPSWKVIVDAEQKKSQNKRSPPKGAVKTPSKRSLKSEVRTPSKSTPIKVKTPKRLKLDPKVVDKTPLKTIIESPTKTESFKSTSSFSKYPVNVSCSPRKKCQVQGKRLIQSEKKLKSSPKTSKPSTGFRKMSLVLKRIDGDRRISLPQKISPTGTKTSKEKISSSESEAQVQVFSTKISDLSDGRKSSAKGTSRKGDASFISPKQTHRKSVKSTTVKTPRKSNEPSNQISVKKVTKNATQTTLIDLSEGNSGNTERTSRESVIFSHYSPQKLVRKTSIRSSGIFQAPKEIFRKDLSPSLEKTAEKSSIVSPVSTPPRSRKSVKVNSKKVSSSKEKEVSPWGVRRKLSPSISSAEKAAKKLKTSSPKKPDKNKRAALLVLGKANRKQLLSQNVKVLLKQKIVKKAIKQSVALPIRKGEKKNTSIKKVKKVLRKQKKTSTKVIKTTNVSTPARNSQTVNESPASNKLTEKSVNEPKNDAPVVKNSPERSSLTRSKMPSTVSPAKVSTPSTGCVKSPTKNNKRTESILSPKSTNQTISPFVKLDKSSGSYIFNSNRRCSKRLSSKNDTERPDFVELSPTALGLIPKNIEIFKTPKEKKRNSSSLVTPRSIITTGIIKSASTSKIGNRKNVSFSTKDMSVNTTSYTPNNNKSDFDFDLFHTSDITMDMFVSPLDKSSGTPMVEFVTDENVKPLVKRRSTPGSKKVVRKLLQSPQREPLSKSSQLSDQIKTPKSNVSDPSVRMPVVNSKGRMSPRNDVADVTGVPSLLTTPKQVKSPIDDLTDVSGIKKLFDTSKVQTSPRNELTDMKGVKQLMRTPKQQKSPKNDLSDLRGVKKLMRTPKQQKSPKNDLSDLRGVKKLMRTPKEQKSPKNDLSDLRGVKKLMRTPKEQKSPKNDLSDLRKVKKLMRTPKEQKSPKNDLSDLRGVKKLMRTPKEQKSPKNDLSDLRGVKKLMRTPKQQKSPKNDLSDLRGVKKLMRTPKEQKSPKNDLSDLRGVKKLMRTPKQQKSPKNDLSDLRGVKKLMLTPRKQKSPKNELINLRGVKRLLQSPRNQKSPKNDLTDVTGVKQLLKTPKAQKNPRNNLTDVEGLQELFASPMQQKSTAVDSPLERTVKKTYEGPKNDLSDVTGVRELFEMFKTDAEEGPNVKSNVSETKTVRGRQRNLDGLKEKKVPTTQTKRGSKNVKTRSTRNRKQDTADDSIEKAVSKRAVLGAKKTTRAKNTAAVKKITRARVALENKVEAEAPKISRKRTPVEEVVTCPPKLRRTAAAIASKRSASKEQSTERKTVALRPRTRKTEERVEANGLKKAPGKSKTPPKKAPKVQSKTTKSGPKSVSKTQKVQKARSQTGSKQRSSKSENVSPRKTRSVSAKNSSQKTRTNAAGRRKLNLQYCNTSATSNVSEYQARTEGKVVERNPKDIHTSKTMDDSPSVIELYIDRFG